MSRSDDQRIADILDGVPWTDVTRLRVVLAHHYHRVDAEQVWVIARDEVPALAAALEVDHDEQAD